MRLSEFLNLKIKDRVELLFEWFNVDIRDKWNVLIRYDHDYERVFREHFGFYGKSINEIIRRLARRGFIYDDTVDVKTRFVRDKNGGHGHVIFDDDKELQKYKKMSRHITCNLTTSNSKKYPSDKLDFDPFLGNELSRITKKVFEHRKSRFIPGERTGKMSLKDYKERIKTIKDHFNNKI